MQSSSPRIFISYARADGADLGHALTQRLTRDHGLAVWRDLANLEAGTDWWLQTTNAIDHVEYLVLVITSAALRSRIVRDEWRYARHHGVCVVPVIGASNLDLAQMPAWMRRTHFVDPDEPEQWTRLVRTLEGPCRTTRVPMMADQPPEDFVTRSTEFEALRGLLIDEPRGESVAITAALKGAGGYGKTTLARALCYDDLIQETYYDGILWVTLGEQPGDPAGKLEDLIVTLSGESSGLTSADARRSHLAGLLADRSLLLVIDDVWSAAHLQPFLIGGSRCARLITTRDSNTLPRETREVRVDAMHAEEAVSLLQSGLTGVDAISLAALAARLGEWPLLLKLVNGMLRDRVHRASDTVSGAFQYVNRLLDRRGLTAFDARDPIQRQEAVSVTLHASVARLSQDEQARLREIVIFPEDVDIPIDALTMLWRRTGGLDDVETERLLQTLFSLSLLLDFNITLRRIRIHDVIRAYLLVAFSPLELENVHRQFVEAYRGHYPQGWASEFDDRYLYRFLLFHLAAGRYASEVRTLLLEPEWIEAKLRHTDVAAILSDYESWANDQTVHLIEDAVRLSADVLTRDPGALLPQLLGRVDASGAPELAELTHVWRSRLRRHAWLCPLTPSLAKSGGALVQTVNVAPRWSHSSDPIRLCLSDDGECLAVSHDDTVEIFDLTRGQQRAHMRAASADVRASAAFTSKGRLVAVGMWDEVGLYDVETQTKVFAVQCANWPVIDVTVTPNGQWIGALAGSWLHVPVSGADSVHVWSVETQREIFTVERGSIQRFLISPDGQRVVLNLPAGVLEVWSLPTGRRLARLECHETAVRAITPGHQPDQVVVGSAGGTVQVWTFGKDWGLTTLWGRDVEAYSVAVSSDGCGIILGFVDGLLEYWRVEDGHPTLTTLRMEWSRRSWDSDVDVVAVAVTPDGHRLVSAARNGAVRVWNGSKLVGHEARGESVGRILSITPDGRRFVVQAPDQVVSVRDTATGETISVLDTTPVDIITFDNRWILSQAHSGVTRAWDATNGEQVAELNNISPRQCAIISEERRIVYVKGGRGGRVLCVDNLMATSRSVAQKSPDYIDLRQPDEITALTIVPNTDRVVAILGAPGATGVFLCDVGRSACSDRIALLDPVDDQSVLISTDGRLLIAVFYQRVAIWNLADGRRVFNVELKDGDTPPVAMTPNGRRLILADGRIVEVWDLENGTRDAVFYADTPVSAVASPSDTFFIAGSLDGLLHRLELRD